MANILIVNPSVNMRLAAMEMKMYGTNVKFAYSSDIPVSRAERVFYFIWSKYMLYYRNSGWNGKGRQSLSF